MTGIEGVDLDSRTSPRPVEPYSIRSDEFKPGGVNVATIEGYSGFDQRVTRANFVNFLITLFREARGSVEAGIAIGHWMYQRIGFDLHNTLLTLEDLYEQYEEGKNTFPFSPAEESVFEIPYAEIGTHPDRHYGNSLRAKLLSSIKDLLNRRIEQNAEILFPREVIARLSTPEELSHEIVRVLRVDRAHNRSSDRAFMDSGYGSVLPKAGVDKQ